VVIGRGGAILGRVSSRRSLAKAGWNTDRLEEHRTLESVRHVVLLSQRRAFARVWTRGPAGDWSTQDADGLSAVLDLALIGCAVPLAEAYEAVAFPLAEEG
jgi:hypothetical protein